MRLRVAILTAFSYLELVGKSPRAAGAALYTHQAFGIHFVTFIVCFTVMCSGLTSASSAAKAFAGNAVQALGLDVSTDAIGLTMLAVGFMTLIAIVNARGVCERVKTNVVLTLVELSGLLIIIAIGAWALASGEGEPSRLTDTTVRTARARSAPSPPPPLSPSSPWSASRTRSTWPRRPRTRRAPSPG